MRRFVLAALVAVVPFAASAKKPPSHSPVLQVPPLLAEPDLYGAGLRLARDSGTPRLLAALNEAVAPASPETMAREFLTRNLTRLGLRESLLGDLRFVSSRRSKAGTNVRFDQTYRGLPVYNGRVVVHISPAHRVTLVSSGYQSRPDLASVLPLVSADTARGGVLSRLGAQAPLALDRTELIVYRGPDRARLAWRVRIDAARPVGDWEGLVDALTGELFVLWDRAAYATGSLFDPDPLSSSRGA